MKGFNKQLSKIMNVQKEPKCYKTVDSIFQSPLKYNIWFDAKKFESNKFPEQKAVPVINKGADTSKYMENQYVMEKNCY